MTDERMALLELVEQQADGDLVREMLAFAADRIMEAEVEARTGAGGREVQLEAGVLVQPCLHLGRLVGGVQRENSPPGAVEKAPIC